MEFFLIILIIGVGILAWYFYKKTTNIEQEVKKSPYKPYRKDELRLENVQPGGMIKITGYGFDMKDVDVKIIAKHTYREGEWTWYELEGETGTEKVWLEYEEDDELEVFATLQKLKLRDLGIEKTDLENIERKDKGKVFYKDIKFYFEDVGKAVFYKFGEDEQAQQFKYWDFENEEGDKIIGIEEWDGSLEVSYSEKIKPFQISVYSLS